MADELGIAVVGAGWITRAHCHALLTLNHIRPLPRRVRLVSVHSRRAEPTAAMAAEFGFDRWSTRWQDAVEDPRVDVVAVLTASGGHLEVANAAVSGGKSVLVEKPLADDVAGAFELAAAAAAAPVSSATGYNYRFLPAVRLMADLVTEGRLGEVRHLRACYLQDWAAAAGVTRPGHSGAGSVADYSHILDILVLLTGVPLSVSSEVTSFGLADDDAYVAAVRLAGGGHGVLEASRFALGWKGKQRLEVNGTDGSVWWDMEEPNRLHVFLSRDEQDGLGGFRAVLVTEPGHPHLAGWWPPGHVLGWEHSFVGQWRAFLDAVVEHRPLGAGQASLLDGAVAVAIAEAITTAAADGRRHDVADHLPSPAAANAPGGRGGGTS